MNNLNQIIDSIPAPEVVRLQIAANKAQAKTLRTLLRMSLAAHGRSKHAPQSPLDERNKAKPRDDIKTPTETQRVEDSPAEAGNDAETGPCSLVNLRRGGEGVRQIDVSVRRRGYLQVSSRQPPKRHG